MVFVVPPVHKVEKEDVVVQAEMVNVVLRVLRDRKEKWVLWVPWVYQEKKDIVVFQDKEVKKVNKV